jgi:uncharacterized membrane protein YhaH (DUF805 family)
MVDNGRMTDPSVNATIPLDQPLYGATFGQAVGRFFKKYATFSGRASRSEYWWTYLFVWLVNVVLMVPFAAWLWRFLSDNSTQIRDALDDPAGSTPMIISTQNAPGALVYLSLVAMVVFELAVLIPRLAVAWRRLHDAGLPGWAYFSCIITNLILKILTLLPSKASGIKYDEGYRKGRPGYAPVFPPHDPMGTPPPGVFPAGQAPQPFGATGYAPPGYYPVQTAEPGPSQAEGEIGPDGLPRYRG